MVTAYKSQVVDDVSDAGSSLSLQRSPDSEDIEGEANVSAEAGSTGESDILDTDLLDNEEGRASGFVGKSSEIHWLRRLQNQLERPEGALSGSDGPYGPPGDSSEATLQRMEALNKRQQRDLRMSFPANTSTFYLDNDDVEVDYRLNPYELPPLETAQRLLDGYMDTVQDSFPILPRSSFTNNLHRYYQSLRQGTPFAVPNRWLAIVNLVFAVGAKYSHLIQADWQADDRDHIIYQSRAHILGLHESSLVSDPDLMQVQATSLLALYFLVIGRVNR